MRRLSGLRRRGRLPIRLVVPAVAKVPRPPDPPGVRGAAEEREEARREVEATVRAAGALCQHAYRQPHEGKRIFHAQLRGDY